MRWELYCRSGGRVMTINIENVFGLYLRDKRENSIIQVLRHGEILLGRGQGNDIRISNPTVSTRHARIYTYLTVSYIEDLGSTNGTYINGKRIDKHVLHPGDVIRLGEYELVLEHRAADETQQAIAKSGT